VSAPLPGTSSAGGAGALHLPAASRRTIEGVAARGYPHEVCGLLLGRPTPGGAEVMEAVEVRNASLERTRDRYRLDPEDFLRIDLRARALGWDVVGIWHSHPDHPARPSTTDREHAWDEYVYVIVSVEQGTATALRAWCLQGGEFREVEVSSDPQPRRQEEARS
jgi:proteasome lid subunit RPN8/RPN11